LVVHRCLGTIAVKIRVAQEASNQAVGFAPELVEHLTAELIELNAELARIRRRRIVVAVVGGCCALVFGAFAISVLLKNDTNIGLTMLLCAGGCSWFVLFVQRDGVAAATKIGAREADVKQQIAKNHRIAFASKKGIHRVAIDFFLREIRYYPAWIQHSRSSVSNRITETEAVKVDTDSVGLTIGSSKYLFTLIYEHRTAERAQVVLNLCVDESLVLSAGAEIRESQLMVRASNHYVNTIVDGSWIEELFALWAEAEVSHHDAQTTPVHDKFRERRP
jgi:hypothetical protein